MLAVLITIMLLPGCLGQSILTSHQLALVEQEILGNIRKPVMYLIETMLERKQQDSDHAILAKLPTLLQLERVEKQIESLVVENKILKDKVKKLPTFEQLESLKDEVKNLTLRYSEELEKNEQLKDQVRNCTLNNPEKLTSFEQFETLKDQVKKLPTFEQFESFKDEVKNLTLGNSEELEKLEQLDILKDQVRNLAMKNREKVPTFEQFETLKGLVEKLPTSEQLESLNAQIRNLTLRTYEQFGSLKDQVHNLSTISRKTNSVSEQFESVTVRFRRIEENVETLKLGQCNLRENLYGTVNCAKGCRPSWTHHNSSCYTIGSGSKSYDDAQRACKEMGANLAIPFNSEENTAIANVLRGERGWIGINDKVTEGTFASITTGQTIAYNHWNNGEPNGRNSENCVEINYRHQSGWNDMPCSHSLKYVCERPF